MSYPPRDPHQRLRPPVTPGYGPGNPPPAHSGHRRPPAAAGGRTKLVLGVLGVVLGLFCAGGIAAAAVGGDDGPEAAAAETAAAPASASASKKITAKRATGKAQALGGLGDRVRDGRFEFTVTGLDCSQSQVGGQFLNKRAQGKFCQVSVTVKNLGDKARRFDGAAQKAMDAGGSEYSNDNAAEVYVNEDNVTFRGAIGPGDSAKGRLVFDVPRATTLTRLELHDSPSSGGVQVSLS